MRRRSVILWGEGGHQECEGGKRPARDDVGEGSGGVGPPLQDLLPEKASHLAAASWRASKRGWCRRGGRGGGGVAGCSGRIEREGW